MSSALSVKLHLSSDDIRRFAFERDAGLDGLRRYVAREYWQEQQFDLAYADDEGDRISLSNDGDWREALRLHSQGQVLHLFVKTATSAFPSSTPKSTAGSSASVSSGAASGGAAPFNFASLFGGGGQQQGGSVNPMEQLLNLAKTPQGSALLNSFGMTPDSAAAMMAQFASGGFPKMPAQPTANSNNETESKSKDGKAADDLVLICDECDLPIAADAVRFHCLDCAGSYDVHEACKKDTHDATHRFESNLATQNDIARLMELGGVSRDCALEMLNRNNGNFAASLDQLLK